MIKTPWPVAVIIAMNSTLALADGPRAILDTGSGAGDTSVVVQKGPPGSSLRDFEIIEGSGEVFGDPSLGAPGGYSSWKEACKNWKTELKELNKDSQILSVNCNSPVSSRDGGQYTYKSMGSYKMRVRIRGSDKGK